MSTLTRSVGQEVVIGGRVRIRVTAVHGGRVRFSIAAPPDVRVEFGRPEARLPESSDYDLQLPAAK